jgi:hypothetical protein
VLAKMMPGRSPNAIKNRFHATRRKLERSHKRLGRVVGAGADGDDGARSPLVTEDDDPQLAAVAEAAAVALLAEHNLVAMPAAANAAAATTAAAAIPQAE